MCLQVRELTSTPTWKSSRQIEQQELESADEFSVFNNFSSITFDGSCQIFKTAAGGRRKEESGHGFRILVVGGRECLCLFHQVRY